MVNSASQLLWNCTRSTRSGIDVLLAAGFQKKKLIEGLAFLVYRELPFSVSIVKNRILNQMERLLYYSTSTFFIWNELWSNI